MNKNTFLYLALVACMSLVSATLLAENAPNLEHPANSSAPAISANQNQDTDVHHKQDVTKQQSESAHRKWVEEEENRSGKIGYSGFEENDKKQ